MSSQLNKYSKNITQPKKQGASQAMQKTGHLQILRGNLSPEGFVAKITGKEGVLARPLLTSYSSTRPGKYHLADKVYIMNMFKDIS